MYLRADYLLSEEKWVAFFATLPAKIATLPAKNATHFAKNTVKNLKK